jgi:hypothetical protein
VQVAERTGRRDNDPPGYGSSLLHDPAIVFANGRSARAEESIETLLIHHPLDGLCRGYLLSNTFTLPSRSKFKG